MKYFTSMLPKIFCQYDYISDSLRKLWIANNVCWPKKVLCTRQRKNIDKFRSIPISTIDPQHSYCSKLGKKCQFIIGQRQPELVLLFFHSFFACVASIHRWIWICWEIVDQPQPLLAFVPWQLASGKCSGERQGWICSSIRLICSSQCENKCKQICWQIDRQM